MTTIVESRRPEPGREHSYRLEPVPDDACEVQWRVNGEAAAIGSTQGGLRVEAFGRFEMHVQLDGDLDDLDATVVSVLIHCPNRTDEPLVFHAGLGVALAPPLPPAPEPVVPMPDSGGEPPPVPNPGPAPDPEILAAIAESLSTDVAVPPDAGGVNAVTFDARPWPWWRRALGLCPEGCEGTLVLLTIPPFYYTVECKCGGVVQKYVLLFGVVISGP